MDVFWAAGNLCQPITWIILTAHLVTIAQEELPIHQRQGPPSFGPTHFTLEDDAGPGGAPCLEGINEVPLESALR